VAQTLPDYPLDSKMRHSLFLALKEALNNVVRHAEASEVWLLIAMEENELIVAVTDNGRGLQLPAATASGRDGLANMRARLSALGGRCEIRSAPTAGTTVRFGVRLRKDAND
jgi:signal transduction histidine kinase